VTCDKESLRESGDCTAPSVADDFVVCEANSRTLVEEQNDHCREGLYDPYRYAGPTVICDGWLLSKTGECVAPDSKDYLICDADSAYEVDDETPCKRP
jgi:hypothetical protein